MIIFWFFWSNLLNKMKENPGSIWPIPQGRLLKIVSKKYGPFWVAMMASNMCLEERFGSTSKPTKKIYTFTSVLWIEEIQWFDAISKSLAKPFWGRWGQRTFKVEFWDFDLDLAPSQKKLCCFICFLVSFRLTMFKDKFIIEYCWVQKFNWLLKALSRLCAEMPKVD